jgi:hypothetical protein
LAEEIKNKKNERNLKSKNQVDDKPVDFDDGKFINIITESSKKPLPFPGEWVQTLSRKDKKTKQVKQEEDNAVKAKKRAQKDTKRITAELIAKAKKDSENAQQLAKQVYIAGTHSIFHAHEPF